MMSPFEKSSGHDVIHRLVHKNCGYFGKQIRPVKALCEKGEYYYSFQSAKSPSYPKKGLCFEFNHPKVYIAGKTIDCAANPS